MKHSRKTDSERIRSALAKFIGFGYLFYLCVSIPEFARDSAVVAAWWTPIAVPLAFGPGFALLVGGFIAPVRVVRLLATASAVSYLVCLALWLFAWNGAHVDADRSTWLFAFPGVATLASCLVWPWPWVLVHLVSASVLAAVINSLGRSTAYSMSYLPLDVIFGISFIGLFVGAALAAIRTGEKLEETRADAYAAAAHETEVSTRATERARYDRIVHDQVLYTLLLASDGVSTTRLAATAARTLHSLTKRSHDDTETTVSGSTMINSLCQVLEFIEVGIPIRSQCGSDADRARYPSSVLRAFEGAASEALRNSLKHAGHTASREVVIDIECDAVDVVIADTGVGFDPDHIPAGRLGVRGSIHECMLAVDGGSATIGSIPSVVTAVRLHWDRR